MSANMEKPNECGNNGLGMGKNRCFGFHPHQYPIPPALIQVPGPGMKRHGWGRIVNLSSSLGSFAERLIGPTAAYAVSKATPTHGPSPLRLCRDLRSRPMHGRSLDWSKAPPWCKKMSRPKANSNANQSARQYTRR